MTLPKPSPEVRRETTEHTEKSRVRVGLRPSPNPLLSVASVVDTISGFGLSLCGLALVLSCATVHPYKFTNYTQNQAAMNSVRQNRVAVLPLSGHGGSRFADELSIQLGKLNRFDIVERQRITDLFEEQDLDPSRVDQTTAVHLGKMLGAHAVVMGTVNDYRPGRVSANVRVVAVETGEIAWQGGDDLNGFDARVQALAEDDADRVRMARDPDFLAMWLARLLAESVR